MHKESKEFLFELLNTPSPSGFEQSIQKVVKKRVSKFADELNIDVHGNLIATLNPKGKIRVMLAGHCDQIGMMVLHVDEKGFIYFGQIGGIDPSVLPGSRVLIHTRKGALKGVIGHPPVHLLEPEERGKKIDIKKLWIDIGAKDGKEAETLVEVGDPITYAPDISELGKNIIASQGCDDRVGVFVVCEALRLIKEKVKGAERKLPVAVFAVSTVQEEIGLRGATTSCFGIDPHVGIAVDVTHATDNPGANPKTVGTVKLGAGPTIARGANVNPVLEKLLISSAEKNKIDFQTLAAPRATGTDANVMQISRAGVATALIGLPNRYMHTQVELVDLRDLVSSAELIAHTVLAITEKTSFIPS